MDKETLKRANALDVCLETVRQLREEFNKKYPAVNQVGCCGMTEDVRTEWINANIEVLNSLEDMIEKEFEGL